MNKLLSKLTAPAEIMKLIYKTEPSYLLWSVPQIIINSVLPLLYVYAPKLIIEKLTGGNRYADVLRLVLMYAGVLLILNVINTVLSSKTKLASNKFTKKLKYDIGKIAMSLELSEIESAGTIDSINLAKNVTELTETMAFFQRMVSNIITAVGLIYIIAKLGLLYLASIAFVVTLKSLFIWFQFRYSVKMRAAYAQNDRVGNYLSRIAYFNQGGAKELRVNNLQHWFMWKIREYRQQMVSMQYKDFRHTAAFEVLTTIATALQSFLILFLLAESYLSGNISIAGFTMYFSAVAALTAALSTFADQVSVYNRQVMNLTDYQKLVSMCRNRQDVAKSEANDTHISEIDEIRFENVSFAYPGNEKAALENVSISIKAGEKLVIVGLNGAGKSTFIKLLCKFYRPASGKITVNGTDIWSIPNSQYYRLLSAVFQDFSSFAFTLFENVSLSDKDNEKYVSGILRGLGMENFADHPNTYITKIFSPDGVELSGGEGQRIAIARALYRNSPFLILDEPTASLDAKAEAEIYADFFRLSRDKTTVFISHRLAACSVTDNIAVFADGSIKEYGTHLELMEHGGMYAEMYRRQSRPYEAGLV